MLSEQKDAIPLLMLQCPKMRKEILDSSPVEAWVELVRVL